MKRYQIMALARTTNSPLVYNVTDSAAEALNMARKMKEERMREVEIRDAQDDKIYSPEAFAAAHRL